jgi:hypothetical protein
MYGTKNLKMNKTINFQWSWPCDTFLTNFEKFIMHGAIELVKRAKQFALLANEVGITFCFRIFKNVPYIH